MNINSLDKYFQFELNDVILLFDNDKFILTKISEFSDKEIKLNNKWIFKNSKIILNLTSLSRVSSNINKFIYNEEGYYINNLIYDYKNINNYNGNLNIKFSFSDIGLNIDILNIKYKQFYFINLNYFIYYQCPCKGVQKIIYDKFKKYNDNYYLLLDDKIIKKF